jgi:hypothetical protein
MKSQVEQISAAILTLNQPRTQSDEADRSFHEPPATLGHSSDSDQRLLIEEDPAMGTFIYRTIDRTTGTVLSEMPREQLLRLRESPAYSAGTVIAAKA